MLRRIPGAVALLLGSKIIEPFLGLLFPASIPFNRQQEFPVGNGATVKKKSLIDDGAVEQSCRVFRGQAQSIAQVLQG